MPWMEASRCRGTLLPGSSPSGAGRHRPHLVPASHVHDQVRVGVSPAMKNDIPRQFVCRELGLRVPVLGSRRRSSTERETFCLAHVSTLRAVFWRERPIQVGWNASFRAPAPLTGLFGARSIQLYEWYSLTLFFEIHSIPLARLRLVLERLTMRLSRDDRQ